MIDWETLREQSLNVRRSLAGLLANEAGRADLRPPTWNNNLRWHAGHLLTTPNLLTFGLVGEPLPIPAEYRRWFAKGTSPDAWAGEPIPTYDDLVSRIVDVLPPIFDAFAGRADEPYAKEYMTSMGIPLRTPAEALTFSMVHDGIHTGMIQALKRGLNAMG